MPVDGEDEVGEARDGDKTEAVMFSLYDIDDSKRCVCGSISSSTKTVDEGGRGMTVHQQ